MKGLLVTLFATLVVALPPIADACPMKGNGCGKGRHHRHGRAEGVKGCQRDTTHDADMSAFHILLDNREKIVREVTRLDEGVETLTESDDPAVAEKIRDHVAAMKERISEGKPIHMRDPLFAEIFANADKIVMTVEETDSGVRVRETSADDHVARLIKAHADLIDAFLANGRQEMRRDHDVPGAD